MSPTDSLPFPCVVFDLDGTLLDTRQAMIAAINALLVELGHPSVDESQFGHSTHLGLPEMLRTALSHVDRSHPDATARQLEDRVKSLYLRSARTSVRCFPQARELLELLAAEGAWLAICSNQSEESVRALLATFDLLGFFRQIVGGDTLPRRKPDPMPLRWIMEMAGASPTAAVMVGDSELDAQCAMRSGARAVIMAHGYGGDRIVAPHLRFLDFPSLGRLLLPRRTDGGAGGIHRFNR